MRFKTKMKNGEICILHIYTTIHIVLTDRVSPLDSHLVCRGSVKPKDEFKFYHSIQCISFRDRRESAHLDDHAMEEKRIGHVCIYIRMKEEEDHIIQPSIFHHCAASRGNLCVCDLDAKTLKTVLSLRE